MTTSLDTHTDDPGSGFIGLTRALAEAGRGEGLTLGEIRDRLDERGFGILILILSIPCLVPALYGVPQVIGIPILLLAGQLLRKPRRCVAQIVGGPIAGEHDGGVFRSARGAELGRSRHKRQSRGFRELRRAPHFESHEPERCDPSRASATAERPYGPGCSVHGP